MKALRTVAVALGVTLGALIVIPLLGHATWHLYPVRVKDGMGMSRDDFMAALKDRNVGTGIHFKAVHQQPFYQAKYPGLERELPNATWVSERICSLPLFPSMNEDDVRYVVAAVKDVIVRRGRA